MVPAGRRQPSTAARSSTSTSTESTRSAWPAGQVARHQARRRCRDRDLGHPRGPSRPGVRPAPPAGGLPPGPDRGTRRRALCPGSRRRLDPRRRSGSKESGLAERIHYDTHERRSGLVRFLAPDTSPAAYGAADETELGDFVDGSFELLELERRHLLVRRVGLGRSLAGGAQQAVLVDKRITIGGNAAPAAPRRRGRPRTPRPGSGSMPASGWSGR